MRKIFQLFQITAMLCFTGVFCAACASCEKQDDMSNAEPRKVKGAPPVIREIPDETSGFGSLSFISKVDITSPQEAVIKKLYFREGDFVRQGALIVQLENLQIKLAVERAENNYSQALAACDLAGSRLLEGMFQAEAQMLALEKAEAELVLARRRWEEDNRKHQNQETLFNAGGIHTEAILVSRFSLDTEREQILLMEKELQIRKIGSRDQDLIKAGIPVPSDENGRLDALVSLITSSLKAELEAARARLESAEKELSSANIALSELSVTSPSSGVVGARYLEEGERVRAQDKILSLMDTASLYAIFPVREKDALRIERGMKANVMIDGTGETWTGSVDLVYPQADTQSLSFLVRVLLARSLNGNAQPPDAQREAAGKLKPGMFARVTVILGPPRQAVFIPESAIFNQKNNEGSVFVLNGSVLAERNAALGPARGEEREITAGIGAKEVVVHRPDTGLREGLYAALME